MYECGADLWAGLRPGLVVQRSALRGRHLGHAVCEAYAATISRALTGLR